MRRILAQNDDADVISDMTNAERSYHSMHNIMKFHLNFIQNISETNKKSFRDPLPALIKSSTIPLSDQISENLNFYLFWQDGKKMRLYQI